MDTISDQLIGTKLGRYQIDALLGRGRGALVYRAIDPVVDRRVAVKVLDASVARDRRVVEAFLRDTRTLADLRHPHILPIYEAGEQDGYAYFVRLLTDGGTLQSRLRGGKRLPLGEAAAILRPVATALDYAHRQSVIHRNLRPSNILLAADEHVYVTDFSLPGKDNQSSAATTIVNATAAPAYVSPEQARGATLDGRSDIYVLAVILYETLTGRPPFQAENPSETARTVIARHLQDEPPAPSRLNPAIGQNVEAVLLRGLEKAPEKRYPTAAALFYALSEAEEQDRASRRQAASSTPARSAEPRPAPPSAQRTVPIAPTPPATIEADLDDLLATLTVFDTPPADATESVATPAATAVAPPIETPPPTSAETPAPAPVAKFAPPPGTPAAPPAPTSPAAPVAAAKVAASAPADRAKPDTKASPKPPVVAAATSQVAPPPGTPQAPPTAEGTPKRSPLPFIIGGVVTLAVLVALALFALTRGEETTPPPVAEPEPAPTSVVQSAVSAAPTVPAAQPSALPSAAAPTSPVPEAGASIAAAASAQPAGPVRREAIVYAESQGAGKTTNLIAVGADGKERQQIASLPGNAWGPHIATDGRSIVYAVGAGATNDQTFTGGLNVQGLHDLYLLNLDGPVTTRLTTTTAWNAGWAWSPDGKTLAFGSNRDGNAEIYLLTFPEQQVRRITTHAGQDAWPTWTPDGKTIVFTSTRDGYPQLYRMDANGGNTTRLITSEAADSFPLISPDGSKLAYVSQNFGAIDGDIFVANLDGSNATRLTDTGDNGQPAWSPDGTRLAFPSKRDGNYNIYTIHADGTGLARLTDTPTDEVTPTWGIVELPAGTSQRTPLAQLPLLGAIALGVAPRRRER